MEVGFVSQVSKVLKEGDGRAYNTGCMGIR